MKTITIPALVKLTSLHGDPIVGEGGEQLEQTFANSVITLLADSVFIDKLQGFDAVELVLKVRDTIRKWPTEEGTQVDIEDDHHRRLVATIRTPSVPFKQNLAHNLVPHMRPILDAKEKCEDVPEKNEDSNAHD